MNVRGQFAQLVGSGDAGAAITAGMQADRRRDVLAEHHQFISDALARHGGGITYSPGQLAALRRARARS